ncbi:MAG: hypothetical protein KJZ96_12140 [Rhodocyclaceae bacterium]|nr:hypothetical protein [Rhodocyclaceae bacterium]
MRNPASGMPAHAPTAHTFTSPRFTPGPWHEHSHRQIGPDAGIVCEVWSALGWGDTAIAEADANVHLIAAAPALHAALLAALDVVAGCNADGAHNDTVKTIRAALALAQGEHHE